MEMQVCKIALFAVKALITVASAAGLIFQPQFNDDNYAHWTNPNDFFKLLAYHWSAFFAKEMAIVFQPSLHLRDIRSLLFGTGTSPLPPTLEPLMRLL